jgi:hypothetical protein
VAIEAPALRGARRGRDRRAAGEVGQLSVGPETLRAGDLADQLPAVRRATPGTSSSSGA